MSSLIEELGPVQFTARMRYGECKADLALRAKEWCHKAAHNSALCVEYAASGMFGEL